MQLLQHRTLLMKKWVSQYPNFKSKSHSTPKSIMPAASPVATPTIARQSQPCIASYLEFSRGRRGQCAADPPPPPPPPPPPHTHTHTHTHFLTGA